MNQIRHILQYTSYEYEKLFEDLYINWCMMQQHSPMHLQAMLLDQRLINWFEMEYSSREAIFIKAASLNPHLKINSLRTLFDDLTTTIFTYPKPIMADIKRKARQTVQPKTNPEYTYFNN